MIVDTERSNGSLTFFFQVCLPERSGYCIYFPILSKRGFPLWPQAEHQYQYHTELSGTERIERAGIWKLVSNLNLFPLILSEC